MFCDIVLLRGLFNCCGLFKFRFGGFFLNVYLCVVFLACDGMLGWRVGVHIGVGGGLLWVLCGIVLLRVLFTFRGLFGFRLGGFFLMCIYYTLVSF